MSQEFDFTKAFNRDKREEFAELLQRSGFRTSRRWLAPQEWFAVFWAEA